MGKVVIFDLEAKVDFYQGRSLFGKQKMDGKNSYILAFNWKYLGEKEVYGKSIHETKAFKKKFNDDSDLCKYAYEVLTNPEVEGIITHNGEDFDLVLLNTRGMLNGLGALPPINHADTCKMAKSKKAKLGLSSYSLDNIASTFNLERKGKVKEETWVLGRAGNVKALKEIKTYGQQDIIVTEQVYNIIKMTNAVGLGRKHKNSDNCPYCNSTYTRPMGYNISKQTGKKTQRYRCLEPTCLKSWS